MSDTEPNIDPNIKTIVFTSIKEGKKCLKNDLNNDLNNGKKDLKINCNITNALMYNQREKKERVEVETWGLTETDLSFEKQLNIITNIPPLEKRDKYVQLLINHIKTKIHSYRHQDVLKNKYNESEFINLDYVIQLLIESELKCHYCACKTYLLYEIVREMKQWSLDRINNDIGHNKGNLVMACLECNLKRRRTNKDSFFITKNLTITRVM
jgi:hypothetical protein